MIYFVRSASTASPEVLPIKIGVTSRLSTRLKNLRCLGGNPVILLAVMDGGRVEEKRLHRQFVHLRVNPSPASEWFHPGPDLLDFIARKGREWDGTDEKEGALIAVTCRSEFKVWIKEFADSMRLPIGELVDLALVTHARNRGFESPPSRLR